MLEMLPLSKPPLWGTQRRKHKETASLFPIYASDCNLIEPCLVFCFVFGSQMMDWVMNLNSELYMIINECEDCHYVLKLSELSKPYI